MTQSLSHFQSLNQHSLTYLSFVMCYGIYQTINDKEKGIFIKKILGSNRCSKFTLKFHLSLDGALRGPFGGDTRNTIFFIPKAQIRDH